MNRNVGLVCLGLALFAGCAQTEGSPSGERKGETNDELGAEALGSARRPTIRYYLGRNETRCEVFTVDGEAVNVVDETPCPAELLPGERIRIAGRTCTREAPANPTREQPVVCPDPLTNYEKERRAATP